MYKYSDKGWSYPGVSSGVKSYMWNSTGVPSLTFGLDCVSLSKQNFQQLESAQGTMIKNSLGLGKRHHHTQLLSALNITNVSEVVKRDTVSLASRLCKVPSPARSLFLYHVALQITKGVTIPGTIVDRLRKFDVLPLQVVLRGARVSYNGVRMKQQTEPTGLTDSLTYLVHHKNFNSSGSSEHQLVKLLTKAF